MSRTLIRQFNQIRQSDLYDDAIAAGSTMESAPVSAEDDFNSIRSQLKRFSGEAKWYTALSGSNILGLNTSVNALGNKRVLYRVQKLVDITVPAAQNYVILDNSLTETPSEIAAVGAVPTEGAVVAFHAGTFGTHALNEVAGSDALNPKNLLIIRDGTTGDEVLSGSKRVWGLLQSEDATDGVAFDDVANRVQISFVIENTTGDDLIACPAGDIANHTINYSYARRLSWTNVPEQAYLSGAFVDATASTVVTLDSAIDNQSGAATQTQNIRWQIADTFSLDFEDAAGTRDLLKIAPASGNDVIEINIDTLDINNANSVDFLNGIVVDSGGTGISIGATAGQIDSAGNLRIASAASSFLRLYSGGQMVFEDEYKTGSTYSAGLLLSASSSEWDNYETMFGEASLLSAITQAANTAARTRYVGVMTAATNADVNITNPTNLDAALGDYSALNFVTDVNVYFNGVLLRNGADASANHDVYPGTSPAGGDLKFEFKTKIGDVVTMEIYAS